MNQDEIKATVSEEPAADIQEEAAPGESVDRAESDPVPEAAESAEAAGADNEQDAAADTPTAEEAVADAPKKRKKHLIQTPVWIALGIVLLAGIGYFVYSAFFLHLPQNIIWSETTDDITYYYEFSDNNMFTIRYASYEESVSCEELTEGNKNVMRLYYPDGTFDYQYSITGSRILKNQKMVLTNRDNVDVIHCDEVQSRTSVLELPTQVNTDSKLLGEWEFVYTPTISYHLWFNADGSMRYEIRYQYQDQTNPEITRTYTDARNLTYTIADGNINYTIATVAEDEKTEKPKIKYDVVPESYTIDGDTLEFLKAQFTRVNNDATQDEA